MTTKKLWNDPVDDRRGKKTRSKAKGKAAAEPKVEKVIDTRPIIADPNLLEGHDFGRVCDNCKDPSQPNGCTLYDVTQRARRVLTYRARPVDAIRIECVWCGTGQWIREPAGLLDPPDGADYRFTFGVFNGKTIRQIATTDRGRKYIEWTAENSTSPSAKKACETFIKDNPN